MPNFYICMKPRLFQNFNFDEHFKMFIKQVSPVFKTDFLMCFDRIEHCFIIIIDRPLWTIEELSFPLTFIQE